MTDQPDENPPETPALNAWYEAHRGRSDNAKTTLWFPETAPNAALDTVYRGCDKPDVLANPERPTVHVHLGTDIILGGYLDEIEAYFTAVQECIRFARWQADTLAAEQAKEVGE